MAIKISGTTVVDDSRNLVNINSGTIAGIQSGGSVVGAGATTINFIGVGNTFNYNPSTKTLDISISGAAGGVGIQSGGSLIGAGITQLNFIGAGNTFRVNGNTVDISISSGNSVIDKQSFNVGAAGTNLVTLTSPYTAGNVDVYLNGLKLSTGDFTETSANVIGLTTSAVQGDTIDVVSFRSVGSIGDVGLKVQQDSVGIGTSISTLNFVGGANTFFNRGNNILDVYVAQGRINKQTFNVGAAGTTLLTLSQPYESGKIDIYRNGIRLAAADFTETSSTTITLTTRANSGDVVEIQSFIGGVNTSAFSLLDNLRVTGIATVNTELDVGVGATVFTAQTIGSGLVGVGTSSPRYRLEVGPVGASGTSLWVNGDARVTGILTIGTGTLTLDGNQNVIRVGSGVTIDGNSGIITAAQIVSSSSQFVVGSGFTVTNSGDVIVGGALTITGNLTVNGTQTIINTQTLEVADKTIGIASTATKLTNAQLDGAGINIYGLNGDKSLTWDNSNNRLAFNTSIYANKYFGDGSSLTGVVSGVEVRQAGSTVGTSITAINFASGATLTASAGVSTITIAAGIQTETSTAGGMVRLDLSAAQDHLVSAPVGFTTIIVTGGNQGESHTVRIVNTGIATVGFSSAFLFPSGSPPVLPTTSGAISIISFTVHRVGTAGTQLLAGASLNFS